MPMALISPGLYAPDTGGPLPGMADKVFGRPLVVHCTVALFVMAALLLGCNKPVREPAVSGSFYPSDAGELKQAVSRHMASVSSQSPDAPRIMALIAPHAGYAYSGQVAANAYRKIQNAKYSTVVIIGPSHHLGFEGVSVYAEGAFKTPLGVVNVDEGFAGELLNEARGVTFFPAAFDREHSIEVQIPFLQEALGEKFKIVPILMGIPSDATLKYLSDRLVELISDRDDVMIVASTDLSHYRAYGQAVAMDHRTIEAIEHLSRTEVVRLMNVVEDGGEMCGTGTVLLAMDVARKLGATRGELYAYANSGDTMKERGRVVGYAAMGLIADPVTDADRAEILRIARESIEKRVRADMLPGAMDAISPRLLADGAAFVTIKRDGRLRGCIGHINPFEPLYLSIIHNAANAAARDPRFTPMKPEELAGMEVEVSILSAMKPIRPGDVMVGVHGLLLVKNHYSGLLLPQVPVEQGWDRRAYLENLSIKAGLEPDGWKDGATLYGFTAEVIKEQ